MVAGAPYSLSALPQPPYLRVTIKALGDQSPRVHQLRPGTRVAIEAPYGTFTRHARIYDRVVLIGAGVGMTPLRALLEDLPGDRRGGHRPGVKRQGSHPPGRGRRPGRAARRRLHEITGSRRRVRFDARVLRRLVPDLAVRDVYVCGPDRFSADVIRAASRLGVAEEQIHREAFGF